MVLIKGYPGYRRRISVVFPPWSLPGLIQHFVYGKGKRKKERNEKESRDYGIFWNI